MLETRHPSRLIALPRLITLLSFLLGAPLAQALPLHVDVRDINAEYAGDRSATENLVSAFRRSPGRFFPSRVTFPVNGARRYSTPVRAMRRVRLANGRYARRNVIVRYRLNPSRDTLENSVYGVELEAQPRTLASGHTELSVIALVREESERTAGEKFFFQRMTVELSGRHVENVTVTERIPLSRTSFTLDLGLYDRRMVLSDASHGITKVYPVDVGSLDFGTAHGDRPHVLTPMYRDARIESGARAIFDRDDPFYFQHMPFLKVIPSNGRYGGIGIHVQMTRRLRRGFESHGCTRLRFKDLFELYFLLEGARGRRRIPVNMHYDLGRGAPETPFPRQDDQFNRVMWPHEEDEYGLDALERMRAAIPSLRDLLPESRAVAMSLGMGDGSGRDAAAGDESGIEDLPGEDD